MGWKDAPLVDEDKEKKPAWMSAPTVDEETQPDPTPTQPEPQAQAEPEKSLFQRGMDYFGKTLAGTVKHPVQTLKGLGYGAAKSIAGTATDFAANVNPEDDEDINLTMPGRFNMRAPLSTESSKDIIQRRENLAEQAVTPITENLTPQESRAAKIGEILLPASAGEIALGKPIGALTKAGLGAIGIGTRNVEKSIKTGVEKGIKPTVIGKETLARREGFYDDTRSAVETIAQNRHKINIVDENGNQVSTPKSLAHFAQAIDQTKKNIYKQYNDMAMQAGDNNALFKSQDIVSKLESLASPEGFYKGNTSAQQYASSLLDDIKQLEGAAPDVIQERIRELNESLAPYYSGRADKVKARIDASVADAMRKQLDDQITNAVGEGYQDLKNAYGSLKAIEQSVNKAALKKARKNQAGIFDLTDIFTGGEIVSGVLTLNPALIAKGASGIAIKNGLKSLNDPDRYIKKMFDDAYKSFGSEPAQQLTQNSPIPVKSQEPAINLETPTYLRKGRAPLPEQPLESKWADRDKPKYPLSDRSKQLIEDVAKKSNKSDKYAESIEGIDFLNRDAAGDLTQQITEKKRLPITLDMNKKSVTSREDIKKQMIESLSSFIKKEPLDIKEKGSSYTPLNVNDFNEWFANLRPEERTGILSKFGVKKTEKTDALFTQKELSDKQIPSSLMTQLELSKLRWTK